MKKITLAALAAAAVLAAVPAQAQTLGVSINLGPVSIGLAAGNPYGPNVTLGVNTPPPPPPPAVHREPPPPPPPRHVRRAPPQPPRNVHHDPPQPPRQVRHDPPPPNGPGKPAASIAGIAGRRR